MASNRIGIEMRQYSDSTEHTLAKDSQKLEE